MMPSILRVKDLSVAFPKLIGVTKAVRDCSFEIAPGEVLGLVGESGSGKSVTAMACLGLVGSRAQVSGSIELEGREVVGCSDRELAEMRGGQAAIIFQNPSSALNPFFTIGAQIGEAIRRHRKGDCERADAVAVEALQSVQLPDPELVLQKYPHQMSGGQLQRAMIAMALACRPRLLIADEPTTALDVTVQAQILYLLRELAERESISILFITHDLGVVASLCDRVVVMYAGRIVEDAGVHQLFEAPAHPYSKALLETIPELGRKTDLLRQIPGQVPGPEATIAGCSFHPRCSFASAVCRNTVPVPRVVLKGRKVACHHALVEISNECTAAVGVSV